MKAILLLVLVPLVSAMDPFGMSNWERNPMDFGIGDELEGFPLSKDNMNREYEHLLGGRREKLKNSQIPLDYMEELQPGDFSEGPVDKNSNDEAKIKMKFIFLIRNFLRSLKHVVRRIVYG